MGASAFVCLLSLEHLRFFLEEGDPGCVLSSFRLGAGDGGDSGIVFFSVVFLDCCRWLDVVIVIVEFDLFFIINCCGVITNLIFGVRFNVVRKGFIICDIVGHVDLQTSILGQSFLILVLFNILYIKVASLDLLLKEDICFGFNRFSVAYVVFSGIVP